MSSHPLPENPKVLVLGAGSWGTSIGDLLAHQEAHVTIWARKDALVNEINQSHTNSHYLPGIDLHPELHATTDLSVAAECDLIVASEDAQFGITETKRGLPGSRVWAKLNAFMPSKIVTEMMITGEPVEAAELYRLGLINRLVPTGEHLTAAEELAEKVLKSPPLATRAAVKLTRRQWVQPGADADMQMLPLKLHLTEDFKEASQSFVEKRAPEYHAR